MALLIKIGVAKNVIERQKIDMNKYPVLKLLNPKLGGTHVTVLTLLTKYPTYMIPKTSPLDPL